MIEDKIKVLRQAAMKSNKNKDEEKVWCVIAGNVELIDKMAYKAIASNYAVKILFREHVILKKNNTSIKFDFIMLYGSSSKIQEFKIACDKKKGAFIQISPIYLEHESNLMVWIAPDDIIKKTVNVLERSIIPFAILLESQTTGFIDVELNFNIRLPKFIKSALKPLYSTSDVVLSTILISVENDEDVKKVQSIATSNKIFVINIDDVKKEAGE